MSQYQMGQYQEIMQWGMEHAPHAVRLVYRHTDGTLRMFRYSDMEYLGISPYDFPKAPAITPELAKKVELAENKPAV